ncbi:bifunctional indole-3-glycerol-phosphate synthase TrpC/phosphoribosylanthranilate isomerase TrpF [Pantoea sp. Nvir]|uniref:bifunctional indole-3-glycerol-phosphate synthase TrpC/phosphoribosylanthranilate isomerase TrpF n=1 Tax=Pantoea sp. Nvir TaxID=2576760 RepID=UPI00135B5413|nr:bifunctional indole-3-glycerol-phosphate synthase TrpC/phosphoribosylanthranilate isomerase TrpF [Pantoea sp. Nvir]MXP66698.1 bifunctional indole-3-glycerol-phosphate synthase TrpC/phosphoribosylanthranilate isomerase TrpF [Pantoea sp. Nvir]CAJ0991804.1 Tryptophan biosynthesis protein TrpCF [Pantoea sp. Nvir]
MQSNILEKILQDKALWVEDRKVQQPLKTFQNTVQYSTRSFYHALHDTRTVFILECKKASPTKGLIRKCFNPSSIASIYCQYASAVSVLTDEKYFQGSFDFLPIVSTSLTQPVVCKDFIIDPYQIYLARHYQADAILLMLSVLDDKRYHYFTAIAHSLKMGVLTEVSNEAELVRAIALKAKVVGINNRDLRDMSIDLNRTRHLAPLLSHDVTIISESGIHNYAQVRELSHFVNGFLIGSTLMEEQDLEGAVRRVLLGENKVCGLTRKEDAHAAYEAGAIYGGLIFAEESLRHIGIDQARQVMSGAMLRYVGVFRNAQISDILTKATALELAAVQLHGKEDRSYVSALHAALPPQIAIWKALSIKQSLPARDWPYVDRYVFDNGNGGSGKSFDWSLLKNQNMSNVLLAGGLSADNCTEAACLGCVGLDFNSGVENVYGFKEAHKIALVFRILREY